MTMPVSTRTLPQVFEKATCKSMGAFTMYVVPHFVQLKHVFQVASGARTQTPIVLIALEYKGVVGYGEASMPPYLGESHESVLAFLSKVDLSPFADPFCLEDILSYVDNVADRNTAAKASIDIALHDLLGKLIGQPWYKLWGLNPDRIAPTSMTIGIDSVDVIRKKVAEAADFSLLKVKLGSDHDKKIIETIRVMTDQPICVDANQGWESKEQAYETIEWLAERNVIFVEQPMPKERWADHAWLKERSPLPIVADEAVQRLSDVVRAKDAYHGINIKLMKCTGMHEAKKMITVARALGLKVMLGCMTETSCAISAAAQLAPLADWIDLDGALLIKDDLFEGMQVKNGQIILSEAPGVVGRSGY